MKMKIIEKLKNKKKIVVIGILVIIVIVILLSKFNSRDKVYNGTAKPSVNSYNEGIVSNSESAVDSDSGSSSNSGSSNSGSSNNNISNNNSNEVQSSYQKLIKRLTIKTETRDLDKLKEKLSLKVKECNGYIESSYTSERRDNRYTNMQIRVPEDKLEKFKSEVDNNSNVTSIDESTEDVTLTYVDVESHLKALKTEQDTLLKLLNNAVSLSETLEIQSRLTDIRYEIESYQSRLNTLDNMIAYSTISISISEVDRKTISKDGSLIEQIKNKFVNSCYLVVDMVTVLVVNLLGYIPIIILVFIVILLVKLIKNKKNKGRD